nr:VOC family protein [Streptosporangium amethystogenes]
MEEVDRLVSLGATRIDIGRREGSRVLMADPDGNEFCVLTPPTAGPAPGAGGNGYADQRPTFHWWTCPGLRVRGRGGTRPARWRP